MIKRLVVFILCLVIFGCARVQTLNLAQHNYSQRPNHIIWFQVAGFSEEQIPLLRFNVADASYRTNLEKIDCLGKMWSFNLYELRPLANRSFLSQISGSKNIKGQCEDFETRSVWDFMSGLGYAISLLENGANEEVSLQKSLDCKSNKFLNFEKLRFYRMGPEISLQSTWNDKKIKPFHYQDSANVVTETLSPGLYYDKSCRNKICYSSLSSNFKTLWSESIKQQQKTFFLVQDFTFLNGIKKKDLTYAKGALLELDRTLAWLAAQNRNDILVIITGAESINIEYPKEGKEWAEYERSGKNIIFKNSSLMSPVLASGAMAENFCGLFDESEMLKRIIYQPEQKKFNWDVLNPFSN